MRTKLLFTLLFLAVLTSRSQVTIEFFYTADGGNKGLSGYFKLCNNGGALPAGYSIDFRWPALLGLDNINATRNGTGECDTWTFEFENWQLPGPGQCKDVYASKSMNAYEAPLRYPAYGIASTGDTVWVQPSDPQYIPKSYNAVDWEYKFDPECFIPSPDDICLGEAQIREWNNPVDVRVPDNRKGWAIVAVHIATLFNNMSGLDLYSVNYAFAQSIIEGRMGCDNGINPPGGDDNPITYQAGSGASGCFQILPPGWAQIQQYYPSLTSGLSYNDIIANDNFITAGLSKVLYDMTTFVKYEKVNCADPIGFFQNAADPYAIEELIAYAYHEGPYGSEGALLDIFGPDRATALAEPDLAEYLSSNYTDASVQYAERMRNNLIQLENNFGIAGGSALNTGEAQTNWVGGSPPDDYEWHGCYNEDMTWADFDAYIDEAATLFWTADVAAVKAAAQAAFNAINGGAPVPFSQIGPVVDAMVLEFPAYSPDEGLGDLFFASACGSPSVTMSSCDEICPGEEGELWVHLMGVPPFQYTIQAPDGSLISKTGVMEATDLIKVDQPGTYKVIHIEDANGEVFLNCHNASSEIRNAGDATAEWNRDNYDATNDCYSGDLVLDLTGTGPWDITYTKNGGADIDITVNSSPHTIETPSPGDEFILKRMVAGGCDSELSDTIEFCNTDCTIPQLEIINGDQTICEGDTAWVQFDFTGDQNFNLYLDVNGTKQDFTSIAADSYLVPFVASATVSIDSLVDDNGCANDTITRTFDIVVNPTPIFDLGNDTAVCASGYLFDIQGPSNMDGYSWTGNGTDANNVFTVNDSGEVKLTIDSAGCIFTDSLLVTTNPTPVFDLGNDTAVCASGYSFDIEGPVNMDAYTWTGNGSDAVNVFTVNDSGEVKLTVDSAGCIYTDSLTVSTIPSPVFDLGNDTTVCEGVGYTFDVQGPTGMDSYVWTGNGSDVGSVFTVSDSGKVLLTVDSAGCSYADSIQVSTAPSPVFDLGNDTAVCVSGYPFNIQGPLGVDGYNWIGNGAGINDQFTVNDSGYVKLTVDVSGCEYTDSLYVSTIPTPVFDLGNDTTVCVSGYTFDIQGPVGMDSYVWTGNGANAADVFTVADSGKVLLTVDSAGCSYTDSLQVGTYAPASVDLGNDTVLCDGPLTLDAGAGFASYSWNGSVVDTNQTLEVTTTGEYIVEVANAQGCVGSDTIDVTINTTPVADIGDTATICPTSPAYNFDATTAGATYAWHDGSTNPVFSSTTQELVWVDVTVNGCTDRDSAYLRVSTELDVQIGADQTICPGESAVFYSNFAGQTHDWNNGAGALDSIVITTAGQVTLEVTDAGGCSGRDTAEVFIENPLTADLGADRAICADAPAETFSLSPRRNDVNYTWSDNSTADSLSTAIAGEYWLEIDSAGCTARDTVELIVNALPTVSLGNDTFICVGAGQTITLDPGAGYANYAWNNDANGGSQTFDVTAAGNYGVVVTDANGCVGGDTISVVERTATVVELLGGAESTTICPGGSASIDLDNALVTANNASWLWHDGSNGNSYVVNGGTDGDNIGVSIDYTNEFGCVSEDTVTVRVRNVLPISITADTACEGETVVFSTGYTGAEYTHEWNSDPANNSETFTINNVQLADAGFINVEVTSNLGCSGDTAVELIVNPTPTPQLDDDSLCVGENISLNTGVLGTHVWSSGGNTNPLNLNNVVLGDAGNYSVTVTDVNGCNAEVDMNLSVFENPTVSIIEPAAACEGSAVTLVTNLGAGYTLTWDNSTVGNSYEVTMDGQYTVEAVHDASGCSADTSITVDFLETPTVVLPQDSTICDYNDLYIAPTNLEESDVALYTWNWSTGESTYGIVIDQAGEYILEVTNQVCTGRDTFNLGVSSPPVSMLMGDTVVCFDDIDSLTLDPGRVYAYLWDDGSTDQIRRVYERGEYEVELTDEFGCTTTDQIGIKDDCPSSIWIPNTFTPNDDGLNDVITIMGRGVEEVEMFIYNRWGEQIWVGNQIGDSWDGTYMNNPVQQDVYVYTFTYKYYDVNGTYHTRNGTGTITLIKH